MAILKQNLIDGQKPEFGNTNHINFCKRLQGILNGDIPIIQDEDFKILCENGIDFIECEEDCRCNKIKATFSCINCSKQHSIIAGYGIINSPVVCSCGSTYSEKYDGQINDWFLIGDGSEDTIY
jgi:hypothetical protein